MAARVAAEHQDADRGQVVRVGGVTKAEEHGGDDGQEKEITVGEARQLAVERIHRSGQMGDRTDG